jgi:hypothetical protein
MRRVASAADNYIETRALAPVQVFDDKPTRHGGTTGAMSKAGLHTLLDMLGEEGHGIHRSHYSPEDYQEEEEAYVCSTLLGAVSKCEHLQLQNNVL